jgi:hypothetical protein
MRYCGRDFTPEDLDILRRLIAEPPGRCRTEISRLACQALGWHKPDGGLKEMSCRVAMLRMQADGLLTLPPPRSANGNGRLRRRRTVATDPEFPLELPADQLSDLGLESVKDEADSRLWGEYVDRYHYLGYRPLPGAQFRYFARTQGRIVALLGFGAAAWKVAARDRFIGWTDPQRRERLHLVANNARFLILPWVHSRNLASKLLALSARQLPRDWNERYGYSPVLLETFVEVDRFHGTCYKAANWVCVGQTQGRGKLDVKHTATLPLKTLWLLPLRKDFRTILCS